MTARVIDGKRIAADLRADVGLAVAALPFQPGPNKRVAVKIVDDRGIESLRILEVD
jgi:adenine-specific DNA-methyltransferase